jgi:hypothetical protein
VLFASSTIASATVGVMTPSSAASDDAVPSSDDGGSSRLVVVVVVVVVPLAAGVAVVPAVSCASRNASMFM